MRRLAAGLLLGFLVSALAVPAGAAGADADRIARRVDRAFVGGRLELEEAVTIGRFKIRLARWVLGFVDDEPDARFARRLMDDVRKVEVRTYRVRGDARAEPAALEEIGDRLGSEWQRAVSTREPEGGTWLYMRPDGDSVDGILVVEWSGREVEVVSIDGRLDGLLDAMVEEAGREGGRASGALGPLMP